MHSNQARRDAWGWLLLVLGLGSVANALWMLVDPERWYHDLPAAVPHFGAFNPHFVRDIGCAFLTAGLALVAASRWAHWRLPLTGTACVFFVAHAVLHVHDTARGLVEAHHWWLDAPGVYLPSILLVWATVVFAREERSR